ncbi:hypothetical protein HMPREF9135_0414 [Segatella baroniae F0067]|uniref:Uncharacterized protein n=1 Tax=Segatella baroniae F0067 TaxID=1115809 RepID=U2QN63_9BACT|nr:hypothetical protein HMPREF9135_0414 [Segatella baroniae F0067]
MFGANIRKENGNGALYALFSHDTPPQPASKGDPTGGRRLGTRATKHCQHAGAGGQYYEFI